MIAGDQINSRSARDPVRMMKADRVSSILAGLTCSSVHFHSSLASS